MPSLPTLHGASPLNANDTTYLSGTAIVDTTEVLGPVALDNTPADFGTMDSGLTWTVVANENATGLDDTLTLRICIRNAAGDTVLAGASSTYANRFQQVYTKSSGSSTTDATYGATAFTYVNTTADKTAWDNAVIEFQHQNVKSKGPDAIFPRVDYVSFDGTYTVASGDTEATPTALTPASVLGTVSASGGAEATPSVAAATATINTVVLSSAVLVAPTALVPTGNVDAPVASGGGNVTASAAGATTTLPPPTIETPTAAGISFVGIGAMTEALSGNDITPALPAGVAADDLIILWVGLRIASTSGLTVSGYTEIDFTDVVTPITDIQLQAFYKVAGASESDPFVDAPASFSVVAGWCEVYRGVDTTSPIDATAVSSNDNTNAATFTPTGISTSTDGAWAVAGAVIGDEGSIFLDTAQGHTLRAGGASYDAGGGQQMGFGTATREVTSAGAVTAPTFGHAAGNDEEWAGTTFALKPAAGGGDAEVTATAVTPTSAIPTPSVSGSAEVTLTALAPTSTRPAPTVSASSNVDVTVVGVSASITSPALASSTTATPAALSPVTTLGAATVSGSASVSANTLTSTGTVASPTVDTANNANVGASALIGTYQSSTPSVSGGANTTPGEWVVTTTLPSPTVETAGNATATPTSISVTTSIGTPTLSSDTDVTASALTRTAQTGTPVVSGGASTTATALTPTASAGTVVASGGADPTPTAPGASSSIPVPAVSGIVTLSEDFRPFSWVATGRPDLRFTDEPNQLLLTDFAVLPLSYTTGDANIGAAALTPTAAVPTPTAVGSPEDVRPLAWVTTGRPDLRFIDRDNDLLLTDFAVLPLETNSVELNPGPVVADSTIPIPSIAADVGFTDPRPFLWKVTGIHEITVRDQGVAFTARGPVPFTAPPQANNAAVQAQAVHVIEALPVPSLGGSAEVTPAAVGVSSTVPVTGHLPAVRALATIPAPAITAGSGVVITPTTLGRVARVRLVSLSTGSNANISIDAIEATASIPTTSPDSAASVSASALVVTTRVPILGGVTPVPHMAVGVVATPLVFVLSVPTQPVRLGAGPGEPSVRRSSSRSASVGPAQSPPKVED